MSTPLNPFAAPAAMDQTSPRKRRLLGPLGALLVGWGAGHLASGRWRRAAFWCATRIGLFAGAIAATLVPAPGVALGMCGLLIVSALSEAVDAFIGARSRPHAPHWLATLACFAGIYLAFDVGLPIAVRANLVEAFQAPSGSMLPTILIGDHIFVDKRSLEIRRGDVIVFEHPVGPGVQYLKRVVALAGDTVAVDDDVLIVNGQRASLDTQGPADKTSDVDGAPEAKLSRETMLGHSRSVLFDSLRSQRPAFGPFVVPADHVFVMGDNRDNSNDSRSWGAVPIAAVRGRALFAWWSRSQEGAIRWDRLGAVIQ